MESYNKRSSQDGVLKMSGFGLELDLRRFMYIVPLVTLTMRVHMQIAQGFN